MASVTETTDIKSEIRHLTRRVWRIAAYVICSIVATGIVLREIHLVSKAFANGREHHVVKPHR